ncbi:MAG: imidazolonepropionase [Lentisphaerae bacterium]|nr:imidazolonepropionase [Lentisphaerota bacterium]
MIIRNLAGVLRCDGFAAKRGRHPQSADYSIEHGPIDIVIDDAGCVCAIGHQLDARTDREIDGAGLLATPAFVDAHTHAIHAGSRAGEYFQRWAGASYLDIERSGGGIASTITAVEGESEESLTLALISRLERCAALGSALVEVKSGYAGSAEGELRMLRAITKARDSGFDIYRTFMPLHVMPPGVTEAVWVEQMIALLPVVARQGLAEGVDAFVDKGFFCPDSAHKFFSAAKHLGFHVRAHCDELTNIGATLPIISMGGLSVDHLQNIGLDARSMWPIASTVATLLPATSFYLGLPFADARSLIHCGAPVALATDYNPGTAPSPSMLFTMLLAARFMKMTPPEIWCAATYNGAQALARHEQHGWIAEGTKASICLWQDKDYTDADAFVADIVVHQRPPRHTLVGNRVFGGARD